MTNIILALANLSDEPIVSNENEKIFQKITAITRTADFEELSLEDEKLDELVESLRNQEEFSKEIPDIIEGLDQAKAIRIDDDEDEEDYI